MKIIKFRAFWKDTLKKIDDFNNQYIIETCNDSCLLVSQFTGLCDKNEKEIYEGDILQFQYGENKVNRLVVYNEENCAFQLQDCKIPEYGFFQLSDWKIMDAIVIGNIYENPNLIP